MTWPTARLSDVLELSIGGVWGKGPGVDEIDVRVWRVTELKEDGRLDPASAAHRSISRKQLTSRALKPGDLLLEKSGGGPKTPVGRVGLVRTVSEPAVCANFMQLLRPNRAIVEPRFLHLYLNHFHDVGGTAGMQTATTNIRNIKASEYVSVRVPLPSRNDQRRIVDLLEDHLSRLDAANSGIGLNWTRLDVLRQSVIDEAFREIADPDAKAFRDALLQHRQDASVKAPAPADLELFDDAPPWPVASLEEVTDPTRVIRYGILKPASEGGDVPYVEVRDLRNPVLDRGALKRTSAALDQQFAGARLRGGDVVVAVRGSFERSAVVPEALTGANVSRDVVRLAPLAGMNPSFVHHWHQTSLSKRYLRRHARGVAVRGVNVGTLRAMPIPVVSPPAQADVVAEIEGRLKSLDRLGAALDRVQRHARVLKRALLAAAFDGSLLATAETRAESSEVANV